MKPKYIEGLLKHLVSGYVHGDQDGLPAGERVKGVLTFAEAGYTDKPVGLRIECADGSRVFVQFAGTSGPGGSRPDEPQYYLPPGKVGTREHGDRAVS
jgi:hypothetical protein